MALPQIMAAEIILLPRQEHNGDARPGDMVYETHHNVLGIAHGSALRNRQMRRASSSG